MPFSIFVYCFSTYNRNDERRLLSFHILLFYISFFQTSRVNFNLANITCLSSLFAYCFSTYNSKNQKTVIVFLYFAVLKTSEVNLLIVTYHGSHIPYRFSIYSLFKVMKLTLFWLVQKKAKILSYFVCTSLFETSEINLILAQFSCLRNA